MENLQLGLDWMTAHGVMQGSSAADVTARELEAGDGDAACAVLLALVVHYDILRRGDLPLRAQEWSPSDLLLRWVRSLSPNPPLSRVGLSSHCLVCSRGFCFTISYCAMMRSFFFSTPTRFPLRLPRYRFAT